MADRRDDATGEDEFSGDLSTERPRKLGGHLERSIAVRDDKRLSEELEELSPAELERLTVLEPGNRLEQGGTYVDLNDPQRRPFKALGGHVADPRSRYVAKRDTDYELWNRLVGDDDPLDVERPERADTGDR